MSKSKKSTANLQLSPHPLGALFPPMDDQSYNTMVDGMRKYGYDNRHPIVLLDGMILEGNHRYTAARKLKITPPFEEFLGDDPFSFVIQENLARRNLTPSQAAAIGAEIVQQMKDKERAEKEAAAKEGKNGHARTKVNKATQTAEALGVSPRNIQSAVTLLNEAPELHGEVKLGDKTLNAATRELETKKSAQEQKSEDYASACERIDGVYGEGFAQAIAAKKLTSKEILELSHLDPNEMVRIKPMIIAGWKLRAALGYQSQALTYGHTIRQLTERATAQGGRYTLELDKFLVEVTALEKPTESPL